MLDYLVTSKARRRLLRLLWADGASGSASELATKAHVAFAGVHRELHAMKLHGLATSQRENGRVVFRANAAYPFATTLRALVTTPRSPPRRDDAASGRTRGELRTLSAPLFDAPVAVSDVEATLVRGVALAHHDPTVARVLPLCFLKARDDLDPDRLLRLARDSGEKQAVGFFLDLTGLLSRDARFDRWAAPFRDRRRRAPTSFFVEGSRFARSAAEENTPEVARRWGLRMNMSLDVFQSAFEKHVDA